MAEKLTFHGVMEAGKFKPDEGARWAALGALLCGRVTVTFEKEKRIRSNSQNARYWSLLVPVAAEILSLGRLVPLSKDQAHYVLKSAFIGCEETVLGMVPISSRTLDTKQFARFCESVEKWLAEKGCMLKGVDSYEEGE